MRWGIEINTTHISLKTLLKFNLYHSYSELSLSTWVHKKPRWTSLPILATFHATHISVCPSPVSAVPTYWTLYHLHHLSFSVGLLFLWNAFFSSSRYWDPTNEFRSTLKVCVHSWRWEFRLWFFANSQKLSFIRLLRFQVLC